MEPNFLLERVWDEIENKKEEMIQEKQRLHSEADRRAHLLGLDGEINGEHDAFRHAFTAGAMSLKYNPWVVALAGHYLELHRDVRSLRGLEDREAAPGERAMDLANNRIGINLADGAANEDDVADRVLKAMNDGRLQTRNDPAVGYAPFNGDHPAVRSSKRRWNRGPSARTEAPAQQRKAHLKDPDQETREIELIERRKREDRDGYFADEPMQKRYRKLLESKTPG